MILEHMLLNFWNVCVLILNPSFMAKRVKAHDFPVCVPIVINLGEKVLESEKNYLASVVLEVMR